MPPTPTSPQANGNLARRLPQLLFGQLLYGIGIALMVRAALGVAPWEVLSQGVSRMSGWSFGLVTNLIGIGVLLAWWPLRQKPGLGTVLNVLLVGPFAQAGLWLFPEFTWLPAQLASFAAGTSLIALATGLYIGSNFGAGPRDGLMTGLHQLTGWPIWAVRSGIEASVLAAGWYLGGSVGWGTLAFALLIGPMCGVTLRWLAPNLRPRECAGRDEVALPEASGG